MARILDRRDRGDVELPVDQQPVQLGRHADDLLHVVLEPVEDRRHVDVGDAAELDHDRQRNCTSVARAVPGRYREGVSDLATGPRTALLESLIERFPNVPPEAVLKEDLLRTGMAFDAIGSQRQPRGRDQAEVVLHLLVRSEAARGARRGGATAAAGGAGADRRPVRAPPHDRLGARQSRLAVPRRDERGRHARALASTASRSPTSTCRRCPSTTATRSRTARR